MHKDLKKSKTIASKLKMYQKNLKTLNSIKERTKATIKLNKKQ